ncbi:MAG: hypothetical protein R6U40_09645 [Desulfobacterales bacterium]
MTFAKTMCILILTVLFVFAFSFQAFSASRLMYENFDDRTINSDLKVKGSLTKPDLVFGEYEFVNPGKNGTGYSLCSGTVSEIGLFWIDNVPKPWPTDELYVSFWMRYPEFTSTDTNENFKFFYPHWDGGKSYVHFSAVDHDTVYYSARDKNGNMISTGQSWLGCSYQLDGNWHHYEFYIKFSAGISKFWYDGVLKIDHEYGSGVWTNEDIYYLWAPCIDAEEDGIFSRQIDDWEVWDGMPDATSPSDSTTTVPQAPTNIKILK